MWVVLIARAVLAEGVSARYYSIVSFASSHERSVSRRCGKGTIGKSKLRDDENHEAEGIGRRDDNFAASQERTGIGQITLSRFGTWMRLANKVHPGLNGSILGSTRVSDSRIGHKAGRVPA